MFASRSADGSDTLIHQQVFLDLRISASSATSSGRPTPWQINIFSALSRHSAGTVIELIIFHSDAALLRHLLLGQQTIGFRDDNIR